MPKVTRMHLRTSCGSRTFLSGIWEAVSWPCAARFGVYPSWTPWTSSQELKPCGTASVARRGHCAWRFASVRQPTSRLVVAQTVRWWLGVRCVKTPRPVNRAPERHAGACVRRRSFGPRAVFFFCREVDPSLRTPVSAVNHLNHLRFPLLHLSSHVQGSPSHALPRPPASAAARQGVDDVGVLSFGSFLSSLDAVDIALLATVVTALPIVVKRLNT